MPDAIYPAHVKVTDPIVINPLGMIFCQIRGLPNNGINLVFVAGGITAQDNAIRLPAAVRITIAIMDQAFRVHSE